jgi:hypothetical protein
MSAIATPANSIDASASVDVRDDMSAADTDRYVDAHPRATG